jgi:hypothetical protein
MISTRRHSFACLAALILAGIGTHAQAQLASDVSVHLTAVPSQGLSPGVPFTLRLEVANEGAIPVNRVDITSSPLFPEVIDISEATSNCVVTGLVIADTPVGHYYLIGWYIGLDPSPPLQAGERRICHLTMSLAATAPPTVNLSFGLNEYFSDENPANDVGTVQLRRAVAQATPVPSASAVAVTALVLLVGVAGMAGLRQRRRSTLDRL